MRYAAQVTPCGSASRVPRTSTAMARPLARWRSSSSSRAAGFAGAGGLVRVVLAQCPHQLVDLADGRAGHFLDGGDRTSEPFGVAIVQQPGGAGLDEDHVDGMAGGIMQFASDAGALLRGREASLPRSLAFGQCRLLFELADPLAT
jgi:hypothetical protein